MKLSKQELADIFDDAADFDGSNELAFDARKALEDGTLQIEGERVEWTKFDKNDPSTYPPVGHHHIAYGHGHMSLMFRYSLATETAEKFADRFTQRYGFTHWRPAPKAPVETEETK